MEHEGTAAAIPSGKPSAPRFTVALAVSGSIAAYKAPIVARLLLKAGVRVIPVMTKGALEFVGAQTLSGLTGENVHTELFDSAFAGERHIELGATADVVAIVPATADLLARLAAGRADDLVTALCLSASGPVVAAPAMHPRMWSHPATQRNVAQLTHDGRVKLVGPVFGEVASGESGVGRMAEPEEIAQAILAALEETRDLVGSFSAGGPGALSGKTIIVTAGPTVEDVDPVRFVSNRSSGKMGFAIAERAAARGARVKLIAGPVTLATPPGVERGDVRSALAMQSALVEALGPTLADADAVVMTAAVGDYRPKDLASGKLKRGAGSLMLELVPNPDLLAELGQKRAALNNLSGDTPHPEPKRPLLVGFAVETDTDERVIELAREKLAKKKVDVVVANHASDSFGKDDNRAFWVETANAEALGLLSKKTLADRILDRMAAKMGTS
jgi:phosphopantothenoylcysteine decarboxylase/phosphopantothenate--cysteine ligase